MATTWPSPLLYDRSLGKRLYQALCSDSWPLIALHEVFGPAAGLLDDVTWLRYAGLRGMPVLTKDEHVIYNPAERAVVVQHRMMILCYPNAQLPHAEQLRRVQAQRRSVLASFRARDGPWLRMLYQDSLGHPKRL